MGVIERTLVAREYIKGAYDIRMATVLPAAFKRAKLNPRHIPQTVRELRSLGWPLSEPPERYGISEADIGPDGPKVLDPAARARYQVRAIGRYGRGQHLQHPSQYMRAIRNDPRMRG